MGVGYMQAGIIQPAPKINVPTFQKTLDKRKTSGYLLLKSPGACKGLHKQVVKISTSGRLFALKGPIKYVQCKTSSQGWGWLCTALYIVPTSVKGHGKVDNVL